MHLRLRPFRWPSRCASEIQSASPDEGGPGLSYKPLNSAIGLLLAPYRPGGRQGDNQHNDEQNAPPPFAVHFDGRGDVAVRYRSHHPMEEVRGFHKSH